MNMILQEQYKLAMEGKRCWLDIKKMYNIKCEDCLVILPSDDNELNKCAIKYLPSYMEKKYIRKSFLVSKGDLNIADKQVTVIKLTFDKIQALLKYYRLLQFTRNVVVISLESPYGNENIINKEDISMDDYVKDAIYV